MTAISIIGNSEDGRRGEFYVAYDLWLEEVC